MNLNDCEQLLRRCCVDLADTPIYLVDRADLASPDRMAATGWTSTSCDLYLRDHLEARGLWRGRGFAAVVDVSSSPNPQKLCGTVLHEATHHLMSPPPKPVDDSTAARLVVSLQGGIDRNELEDVLEAEATLSPRLQQLLRDIRGDRKPWWRHDDQFIRAGLHLVHRAREAGADVDVDHVSLTGGRYRTSAAALYADTISHEVRRLRSLTVREAIQVSPPAAFTELWQADVSYHESGDYDRDLAETAKRFPHLAGRTNLGQDDNGQGEGRQAGGGDGDDVSRMRARRKRTLRTSGRA